MYDILILDFIKKRGISMLNKLLDKLDRKFGRFAISNLMLYIIIGMGVFFVVDMVLMSNPDNNIFLIDMIRFDREKIFSGQIWRVISFILEPPDYTLVFVIFSLYFFWLMGAGLEQQWGSFKFNVFYFTGIIGCIIAGFITGFATNYYLNLSLFLAFAVLFPNKEIYLFFVLPIKVKWLSLLDGLLLIVSFVRSGFYIRVFLLLSVANFLLFFGKDLFDMLYFSGRQLYRKYLKK